MGMSPKYREEGGGPATGLANDFVKFLQGGLNTGSFGGVTSSQRFGGADPVGNTQGIAGVLNDILSGGAGKLGGSMADLIARNTDRNVDALRARFGASGGTSFGTPAAFAESTYRAEQAPLLTQSIGQLQLSALGPLMQMMTGLSGKGIAQREGVMQPSGFASFMGSAAPLIGMGLGLATGNPFAVAGSGASLLGGGGMSGASVNPSNALYNNPQNLFGNANFGMTPSSFWGGTGGGPMLVGDPKMPSSIFSGGIPWGIR